MRRVVVLLIALGLALTACPKRAPRGGSPPSQQALIADVQSLGAELRRIKLPASELLLEAYLSHFRGRREARRRALCRFFQDSGLSAQAAVARLGLVKVAAAIRLRAFLAVLLKARTCKDPRPAADPGAAAFRSGIYLFGETKSALSGDTLTIQERWFVRREGRRLTGWYLRRLQRRSGDGREYRCSKAPRYEVLMAFTVTGKVTDKGMAIQEKDAFVRPDPCAPKRVRLTHCLAVPSGNNVLLRCPTQRVLTRAADLPTSSKLTTGVFRWAQTVPRADGSSHQIEERWHLGARQAMVFGHYLRTTTATARSGKRFPCNRQSQYRLRRLYLLQGAEKDGKLKLREIVALHRPNPCDDGKVKLDAYEGQITRKQLTIKWGSGATQVLGRRSLARSQALPVGTLVRVPPPRP